MKPFIYTLADVIRESNRNLFTFISTFAGGGGSSTGYRLAGGRPLAVNEFIPEAQRVYNINYPDTKIYPEDIRNLTVERLLNELELEPGELDIFDGSPPCSSFSSVGLKEKGWGKVKKYSDSEQRTDDLFFEYARLLKGLQPKAFIAENVKGITMGKANDLLGNGQMTVFGDEEETIYFKLVEAGYKVKYKIINASDYRVPQARERAIFIGIRNDIEGEPVYPKPLGEYVSASEALIDLPPIDISSLMKSGRNLMFEKLWLDTKPGEDFSEAASRLEPNKRGWFSQKKLHPDYPAMTVTTHTEVISHWSECRLFSIPEVKRFCSFPDDYYTGEGYTKQFERLGRAVPPLMMKAIAESVYNTILKPYKEKFQTNDAEIFI
jgi:DNA (cytosine-5)-methyltransferase 1